MSGYARAKGYHVYIGELISGTDVNQANVYFKQNIHQRSLKDIEMIMKNWEHLPSHYTKLDFSFFTQEKADKDDEVASENGTNKKLKSST